MRASKGVYKEFVSLKAIQNVSLLLEWAVLVLMCTFSSTVSNYSLHVGSVCFKPIESNNCYIYTRVYINLKVVILTIHFMNEYYLK